MSVQKRVGRIVLMSAILGCYGGAAGVAFADSPSSSSQGLTLTDRSGIDPAITSAGPTLSQLEASGGNENLTLPANYLDVAGTGAKRRPFMRMLDHFGLAQPLDDMGIDIYGFIQGSYTYSF